MSTPGFTAEHSLYRTRRNYCMSEAYHQANGIMLPELLPQIPASAHGGPPITFCPPGQELCSVSGTAGFCCPPGQSCCDPETNSCCLPGQPCCNGECCTQPRWSCCNGECCAPGWCCNGICCPENVCCNGVCCSAGQACCNGVCCPAGQCGCDGVCCSEGQACYNGCCATNTSGLTLSSKSNYLLINGNCQNMKDLSVSLNVTQDMVAAVTPSSGGSVTQNGGFDLQLNAYNPAGPTTSWMQYFFNVSGNAISYQVQYHDIQAECACGHAVCDCAPPLVNLNGTVLSLSSNTIPAGYVLEIDLSNDSVGNITGAIFTVTDNSGNTTSRSATLPATQQFPIVAFQVNVVGPDGGSNSQFSSGAGTITYEISNGQLCVEGGLPDLCSESAGSKAGTAETAETSNATYGAIGPPCCASQLTQSFQTPVPPIPCCPPGTKCCGRCKPRPDGTGLICGDGQPGNCIGQDEDCQ
jgi:hypothetical protein